jgi:hypothetical protein
MHILRNNGALNLKREVQVCSRFNSDISELEQKNKRIEE